MFRRLLIAAPLVFAVASVLAADLSASASASRFMDAYARDLLAGDRQAVAGRYSRRGAIFVNGSRKEEVSFAAITQDYATQWKPPSSFGWQALAFEALGEQAVRVTGGFLWGSKPDADPVAYSYVAILVLEEGELRIRLEEETPLPRPVAK